MIVPVAYEDPSPATYEEGQTDYAIPIPADRLTKRGSRVNGLSKSSRFVLSRGKIVYLKKNGFENKPFKKLMQEHAVVTLMDMR